MYEDKQGRWVISYGNPRRRKFFQTEKEALKFEKKFRDGFDHLDTKTKLELLLAHERAKERGVSILSS